MTEYHEPQTLTLPPPLVEHPAARSILSEPIASHSAVKHLSQRESSRRFRRRLVVTDVAIVLATIGAGFATVSHGTIGRQAIVIAVGLAVAWLLSLAGMRTREDRILGSGVLEYRRVLHSSALAFGLLAIVFLLGEVDVARGYFIVLLPSGTLALIISRWLWRRWLTERRSFGEYLARTVVVGTRDDIEYVIRQIANQADVPYDVVAAAVVDEEHARPIDVLDFPLVPVVAHRDGVAQAAANLSADAVIIAGTVEGGSDYIRRLGWDLEGTATELVLASRLTDVAGPRIHLRPVAGLPLIQVEIPTFDGGKHLMKRALDVTLTTLGLILISPILLTIALAVKLDSAGPVFFAQERVGRNGTRFQMYKFRSMVVDAEERLAALQADNEGSGALFKMKNDPRITPLGRVLRKYSLDELPQLWNVLRGEMSLVGPRPPLAKEVDEYEQDVHRRLHLKPGLTGMWQVGGRSDLSWDESVRLDLYYVENWSISGDLMLLWRTVKVVVSPVGAY